MATRKYTIILDPDIEEGGLAVTVLALPRCITQGKTIEQCMARAREAVTSHIKSLEKAGKPVPAETERPQAITIDVVT